MKNLRQKKILELIEIYEIETQEELVARLSEHGINAAQATVSRDIKNLNLYKEVGTGGKYKYTASYGKKNATHSFEKGFSKAVLKIDHAQNLVVIKTVPGMANAFAAYIDSVTTGNDLLGTVAGDDTILVVVRSEEAAEVFCEKTAKLISML